MNININIYNNIKHDDDEDFFFKYNIKLIRETAAYKMHIKNLMFVLTFRLSFFSMQ